MLSIVLTFKVMAMPIIPNFRNYTKKNPRAKQSEDIVITQLPLLQGPLWSDPPRDAVLGVPALGLVAGAIHQHLQLVGGLTV